MPDPIRIRRLALQLEMEDGRIMTFYADAWNAAGSEVTITTETQPADPGGYWHPLARPEPLHQTSISIEKLNGYVMTVRDRRDTTGPQWIQEARKGIEQ